MGVALDESVPEDARVLALDDFEMVRLNKFSTACVILPDIDILLQLIEQIDNANSAASIINSRILIMIDRYHQYEDVGASNKVIVISLGCYTDECTMDPGYGHSKQSKCTKCCEYVK